MQDLTEVGNYIDLLVEDLDPDSRYITELFLLWESSIDIEDFENKLENSRGKKWAGARAFKKMTLSEKIRSNLIPNPNLVFPI